MAADKNRDLRRLAKSLGIVFKPSVDAEHCPPAHWSTFEKIRKIGDFKFDAFSASIDIRSSDEPWRDRTKDRAEWRDRTKDRAEWLANRADQLVKQQRNEAGWRFGIENDVLRRFSVEVACQTCRARIWRSEIEACINDFDDVDGKLAERRKRREPCKCPVQKGSLDSLEIGTNPLFEDRVEEPVILDDHQGLRPPTLEMPKWKKPDRIYGLRQTTNFETVLLTLGQSVRTNPFKDMIEPLLFPFLILEAKSERSPNGFNDVQSQTALPIRTLLKLQEDLQARVTAAEHGSGPLVWFLSSRGDAWRVYGCYVSAEDRARYNIAQLWDGSIVSKDRALQLLLIVDYIFDWARDIYRPAIFKQLKSLSSGKPYDQVSMSNDSDIMSMRHRVSNWIPPPPSTIGETFSFDEGFVDSPLVLDHAGILPIPIPNTTLGTMRSASLIDSRINGLYITEHNVRILLQLAGGADQNTSYSEKAARILINFLTGWDELFLLTGEQLGILEETWTGEVRPRSQSFGVTFYVLIEFATFMNASWNIVREIKFFAVSSAAFDILVDYADYKVRHPGIPLVSKVGRACNQQVWIETLRCLQSGSPSQLFAAAVSCTLLSLYLLPERKRADHTPEVQGFGFSRIKRSRLERLVQRFQKLGQEEAREKTKLKVKLPHKRAQSSDKASITAGPAHPEPRNPSFVRVSERRNHVSDDQVHHGNSCERCSRAGSGTESHLPSADQEFFSAYGMSLVGSLDLEDDQGRHDMCVFVEHILPEIKDNISLSVAVEDLFQGRSLYHTIRHPIPPKFENEVLSLDTLWNLPQCYRRCIKKEREHLLDWLKELRGEHIHNNSTETNSKGRQGYWNGLQLLLHFLNEGDTWESAAEGAMLYLKEPFGRTSLYDKLQSDREKILENLHRVHRNGLDFCTTSTKGHAPPRRLF